jgi:hypothetical protein
LKPGGHECAVVLPDLLAAGKVTPVINRRYELSEVADARGKTVING